MKCFTKRGRDSSNCLDRQQWQATEPKCCLDGGRAGILRFRPIFPNCTAPISFSRLLETLIGAAVNLLRRCEMPPLTLKPRPRRRPSDTIDSSSLASKLPRRLALSENMMWSFGGNLVYAASQGALLVLLAKLGSTEAAGRFALALAITTPIMRFTGLELRSIQATDATGQFDFADYFKLRLLGNLVAMLLILGVLIAGGYSPQAVVTIALLALAKFVEFTSDVFHGVFQQQERMDMIAVSSTIKAVASLTAATIGLLLTGTAQGAIGGLLFAWIASALCFDAPRALRMLRQNQPRKNLFEVLWGRAGAGGVHGFRKLWELAWLASPLGVVRLLLSLGFNLPFYFLALYGTPEELGVFAILVYFVAVQRRMLMNPSAQSACPRLARLFVAGHKTRIHQILAILAITGGLLGVAGVAIAVGGGRALLPLLTGSEDNAYLTGLVWLMAAAIFANLDAPLNFALVATRQLRWQVPVNLIHLVLLFGLLQFLVPRYGLAGAGAALLYSHLAAIVMKTLLLETILWRLKPIATPSGDSAALRFDA